MCGCFQYAPNWGPATQACALTGNQISDPLVCRPVLSPLSHNSQGKWGKALMTGGSVNVRFNVLHIIPGAFL